MYLRQIAGGGGIKLFHPISDLQARSFAVPLRIVSNPLQYLFSFQLFLAGSYKELFKPWYRHRAGIHSRAARASRRRLWELTDSRATPATTVSLC